MIPIQDRNVPISAEDIRQRYKLEDVNQLKDNVSSLQTELMTVDNELQNFRKATLDDINDLKDQVDGKITTWFFDGEPTLNNEPAVNWMTDEEKEAHKGDLYYDGATGYGYRFTLTSGVYKWVKLTDSDAVAALALARAAQDTADGKRRVFIATPTPPYDKGDLWSAGANGDLKRCVYARTKDETYNASDWENAAKYVGNDNVIQSINASPESATISKNKLATITADKIQLEGYTTINNGFSVDLNGNMTANNGTFSGTINATSGSFSGTITSSNATITGGSLKVGDRFSVDTSGNLITNYMKASNVDISGKITATSGSFTGSVYSSYGKIGGFDLSSTSLSGSTPKGIMKIDRGSGACVDFQANGGRLMLASGTGVPNVALTSAGGSGANGLCISDVYGWTGSGAAGYSIGIRANYGSIRTAVASPYVVRLERTGGAYVEVGANVNLQGGYVQIESVRVASNTFTGSGGAQHYSNANCMLNPADGYYAYINTVTAANRIATSSSGPSSRNVKKNIKTIKQHEYKNLYEDLQKLELHTFDYKYSQIKNETSDFGFIIDEIEELSTIAKYTKHYNTEGFIRNKRFIRQRENDTKQEKYKKLKYKEWDRDSYIKTSLMLIKSMQLKIDDLERKIANG